MSYGISQPVDRRRVSTAMKRAARLAKARAGHKCEVCGAPELFHRSATGRRMSNLVLGHRVPLERYRGSPTDPANGYVLCRGCNASQGNRTPEEWRAAASGRLVRLGLVRTDRPAKRAVTVADYTRRTP